MRYLHALGQGRLQALHFKLTGTCYLQGVGSGLFDNANTDHGYTVAAKEQPVFLCGAFNAGDITQAGQVIILSLADNQP